MSMVENPTLKTIFNRKSIRKFKHQKVPREIIEQIVRAGQRAPTACKMQSYSFIIVSDTNKKREILLATVRHLPTRKFMAEAPLWIMICTDFARQLKLFKLLGIKTNQLFGGGRPGVIDATLAAENMVLAAEALGLGSCFVGTVWTAPKRIAEILNLPKNVLPIVLLCIGYPNETPSLRPRWPLEAVLHENEYVMPTEQLMREYYEKTNKQLIETNSFAHEKGINSLVEQWKKKYQPGSDTYEGVGAETKYEEE